MKKVWMVPAAALVVATAAMGRQAGEQALTVSAVRFYSPARATTTIEGVCELSLGALGAPTGSMLNYRVQVAIRDSTGQELGSPSEWTGAVPANVARTNGATTVETFEVPPAAPGLYQLVVRVIPENHPAIERAISVRAYERRPPLSDLLLATGARAAGTDTGAVGAGEVRRGSLVLRTAPIPHLTPTAAMLTYYAEIYPWQGATLDGQLSVRVLGADGRVVTQTSPRAVRFLQAGGVMQGSLDLSGLAAGEYSLELRVRLGDSTLVDAGKFVMRSLEALAAAPAPRPDSGGGDPFANLSEVQLDSLYAPLVYLLAPRDQGVYDQLAVEGKRNFLRRFWSSRDSAGGAGAMPRFYRLVDYANQTFREGGAGQVAGWRTDRGRIFLTNGRWDEILKRPMASPSPYEAWKYTRGRQRYYIFLDRSGLGAYQLIATNDRHETGLQNWQDQLGTDGVKDVTQFLGLTQEEQQSQGPQ